MHYLVRGKRFLIHLSCCLCVLTGCIATESPVIQYSDESTNKDSGVAKQDIEVSKGTVKSEEHTVKVEQPDSKQKPDAILQPVFDESRGENRGADQDSNPQVEPKGAGQLFEQADAEPFAINMENADLYEVIMFFIEQLDLNCIIEPNIKGNITIHTAGILNRNDLFPLFMQILEINGFTAIKEGKYYRVVSMANAGRTSLPISLVGEERSTQAGMMLQIIPLKSISNQEMVTILTPFISQNGSLISHDTSSTLLLVDSRKNIDKILKLVRSFDVDLLDSITHRFYWVKHVESSRIAKTASELLGLYGDQSRKTKVINLEKLNAVLVFSQSESFFDKLAELIQEIDIPSMDVEPHIYLYFLKNSQAADMAGLLNSIFTTSKEIVIESDVVTGAKKENENEQNPFTKKDKPLSVKTTRRTSAAVDDYGSGALRSEMKIIQDDIRNALIIKAIPSDYRIIEKVLKRLDILPRQVLISVTIADIQLDDDMELGVEWEFTHKGKGESGISDIPTIWDIATGSSGLFYSIGQLSKWHATLSALAQKKLVDIVATPSILASDNITASIDISTEVPVASAQIQYDNDNTNRTQTDIQYRNTGIILNVTPHINEYGLVSMEVSQEVSEQSSPVKVGDASYPSFFKRSVKTTLTVKSGQTIAIGGLIREVTTDTSTGVPFLADIPLIGWLFGTQTKGKSKSELIILLTPVVVATPDEIDAVTEEFSRKLGYELEPNQSTSSSAIRTNI